MMMTVQNKFQWAKRIAGLLGLASATAFLSGCGGDSGPVAITQTRSLPEEEQTVKLDATSRERFRFAMPAGMDSPMSAPPEAAKAWAWKTPEGWSESAQSPMREVNLRFGPDQSGECYVTSLNAGGTLEDNINRWRTQMGLENASSEEISKLPRRKLLGQDAVQVSLDGAYKAVGAPGALENYRMVGLILFTPQDSIFVKMVGPKSVVEENEDEFAAFCDSLSIKS